ncbi:MAG: 3-methyl-2-oxobutanoate hydroxymethyltransferase [Microbacterium ginsengisoli]|jgi:3-methyl-2-oxobutanoate hydroxymethyltransferase|uniref:3-methyl-2-oxobutanoate hydroxymethyltransferase n=1 Tax=uncultured bacterium Contigcl_10-cl TaxID=1393643 RepID=W0FPX9_9BACT|nr:MULTISPECIES: 3-methyl-2-oxobutanoate hydroxymethyltransferase [unclassified Microbacterium]AHF25549.1 ketopantoate hydroxymethyltransferase [uncultured bacterium Contigcl_10-cl]MBN9198832.1 3-methyl-2-oxobutanoate hydroxymethyltransferase [Microbacterium ginsengisoli]KQS02591.1 3-methyl-2-oxobutanoate hydroxymethyltransferase [Microbacterium sp. Leaf347]KQS06017.1 3-methyl-2-oxobutanoate hydroxymethyltransferase [Microbacterium sp. Leaf351]OJU75603.1 MAG: 3-methyl-2-oxobutanoate hydroxymet
MTERPPVTLARIAEMHAAGEQIVMVTAYDHPSARAAERAGVDMILVGDSAAQVVLGYDGTAPVSLDEMLMLARAVRRAVRTAFVVVDLPFGATELSDEQAVASSLRLVKEAGADAVKLEGGQPARLSRIRAIVAAGIPVVGHIGLTPQTATALGGLRAQGRTVDTALRVAQEALDVEAAGAIALVVEAVPAAVVAEIRGALGIPLIGIGAGAADGQVLVHHDLLGITAGRTARFVKQYAALGDAMAEGIATYATEVRAGEFPSAEHTYPVADDVLDQVRAHLAARGH